MTDRVEIRYDKEACLRSDSKLIKLLKEVMKSFDKVKQLRSSIDNYDKNIQTYYRELEYSYSTMDYNGKMMFINDQQCRKNNDEYELNQTLKIYKEQLKELYSALKLSQMLMSKYGNDFVEKLKEYTEDISEIFAVSEFLIENSGDNSSEHYDLDVNVALMKYTKYFVAKPLSKMSLCLISEMNIINSDVIKYADKYGLREDVSAWYIYRTHKLPPKDILPRNPSSMKFIEQLMNIDPMFDLKSLYDRKMGFEFVAKLMSKFPEMEFEGLL